MIDRRVDFGVNMFVAIVLQTIIVSMSSLTMLFLPKITLCACTQSYLAAQIFMKTKRPLRSLYHEGDVRKSSRQINQLRLIWSETRKQPQHENDLDKQSHRFVGFQGNDRSIDIFQLPLIIAQNDGLSTCDEIPPLYVLIREVANHKKTFT